jgi:membrane-bound lytic murein transglycosylase A
MIIHAGRQAWLAAGLLLLALVLGGCGGGKDSSEHQGPALVKLTADEWPELHDDMDLASLQEACAYSLAYLRRTPSKRFSFGDYVLTGHEMSLGIQRFLQIAELYSDPASRAEALKKEFWLFKSRGSDGEGKVLFTGYYEPVLNARKEPAGAFVHPLYAIPDDLVTIDLSLFGDGMPQKRLVGQVKERKVIPYPDREEIDFNMALEHTAKPLAYLADPVESFFLHIQGSGQVVFEDGSRLRMGYAGTNGRPYRSIGRYLIDQGLMEYEGMSMQAIKQFLENNPQHKRKVFSHNPSYVFFRPLSAEGGPLGCYAQPVTGGRSVATDRRVFPGLAVAYIKGTRPADGGEDIRLTRFALNQDTGGAIRGPGRLDLFFGSGPEAGRLAGRMKHLGELYFFAPKRDILQ